MAAELSKEERRARALLRRIRATFGSLARPVGSVALPHCSGIEDALFLASFENWVDIPLYAPSKYSDGFFSLEPPWFRYLAGVLLSSFVLKTCDDVWTLSHFVSGYSFRDRHLLFGTGDVATTSKELTAFRCSVFSREESRVILDVLIFTIEYRSDDIGCGQEVIGSIRNLWTERARQAPTSRKIASFERGFWKDVPAHEGNRSR